MSAFIHWSKTKLSRNQRSKVPNILADLSRGPITNVSLIKTVHYKKQSVCFLTHSLHNYP